MPVRTSNQIGDDTEERARKKLSGERVPQSGGGKFFKSDIRDQLRMLWEVKGTEKDFFRITKEIILRARAGARGMRGAGDGYRWGVITEIDGIMCITVEIDTWVEVITADPSTIPLLAPSAAAVRRSKSSRSVLG